MLRDANAFSGFAVDDVPRAKEFYGTTLGLEVADAALGVEGADVPAGLELRLGSGPGSWSTRSPATRRRPSRS
jgi:catechol 2,3-dioxygenase-like lactoylglutathione lyase family enzyme